MWSTLLITGFSKKSVTTATEGVQESLFVPMYCNDSLANQTPTTTTLTVNFFKITDNKLDNKRISLLRQKTDGPIGAFIVSWVSTFWVDSATVKYATQAIASSSLTFPEFRTTENGNVLTYSFTNTKGTQYSETRKLTFALIFS